MNETEMSAMQPVSSSELANVDGGVLLIALAVLALELHIWCNLVCD